MSTPEGSDAARELAKLAGVITEPAHRQSFAADPDGTLDRSDLHPTAIPESLLGTLKGLSQEELRVLARVNAGLVDAGLHTEVPEGGSLGFF